MLQSSELPGMQLLLRSLHVKRLIPSFFVSPECFNEFFCVDVKESRAHKYFITLRLLQCQESDDTHRENTLLDLY